MVSIANPPFKSANLKDLHSNKNWSKLFLALGTFSHLERYNWKFQVVKLRQNCVRLKHFWPQRVVPIFKSSLTGFFVFYAKLFTLGSTPKVFFCPSALTPCNFRMTVSEFKVIFPCCLLPEKRKTFINSWHQTQALSLFKQPPLPQNHGSAGTTS